MSKNKSQKQLQVAEQIKRNVAETLLNDNPLSVSGAYLTVTMADVSPDIKNAKIFINIFGSADKEKIIARLNGLSPYFRSQLSKKLNIRHTPELVFILDESGDEATKIGKLINEEKKKF